MLWIFAIGFSLGQESRALVTWDPKEGEAYHFKCFDTSGGNAVPLQESLLLFGCELKADGTNSIACRGPRDVPLVLLFTLPGKAVRKGDAWDYKRDFFVTPVITNTALFVPRVLVKGRFKTSSVEQSRVQMTGTFGLYEGQERNGQWVAENAPSATIEIHQVFDVERKRLESGNYLLAGSVREACSVKQGVLIRSQKVRIGRRIERAEKEWKLDTKELLPSINAAIAKGRDWVAKQQENDGSFAGRPAGYWVVTSMVGPTTHDLLTLLHSGLAADDPAAKRAWSYVLSREKSLTNVYDVSLALLALEARHLPKSSVDEREPRKQLTREDHGFLEKWAKWLVEEELKPIPRESVLGSWQDPTLDMITTWYAAMGLQAASHCGYNVPPSVWRTLLRRFVQPGYEGATAVELSVEPLTGHSLGVLPGSNGWKTEPLTWGFCTLRPMTGAGEEHTGYAPHTCFALLILAICESELKLSGNLDEKDEKRVQEALRRGLAWLQSNWSVRAALPEAGAWGVWHYLYLWALERVASALGIGKIGGHDWYLEGASLLLASQHADGSWTSPADEPTQDTALALLFLKRARLAVETKNGK